MEHEGGAAVAAGAGGAVDAAMLVSVLTGLGLAFYVWGMWRFDRFSARGEPSLPSMPFVGTALPFLLRRLSFAAHLQALYRAGRERPLLGLFHLRAPVLLLREPLLVRRALVADAAEFPCRSPPPLARPAHPLLDKELTLVPGRRWRKLREHLDAALAPARLQSQLPEIAACALRLADRLEQSAAKGGATLELLEPLECFWSEALGRVLLGQSSRALVDAADAFHARRRALLSAASAPAAHAHALCPGLAQLFRVSPVPPKLIIYFRDIGYKAAADIVTHMPTTATSETKLKRVSALWYMLEKHLSDNHRQDVQLEQRSRRDKVNANVTKTTAGKRSVTVQVTHMKTISKTQVPISSTQQTARTVKSILRRKNDSSVFSTENPKEGILSTKTEPLMTVLEKDDTTEQHDAVAKIVSENSTADQKSVEQVKVTENVVSNIELPKISISTSTERTCPGFDETATTAMEEAKIQQCRVVKEETANGLSVPSKETAMQMILHNSVTYTTSPQGVEEEKEKQTLKDVTASIVAKTALLDELQVTRDKTESNYVPKREDVRMQKHQETEEVATVKEVQNVVENTLHKEKQEVDVEVIQKDERLEEPVMHLKQLEMDEKSIHGEQSVVGEPEELIKEHLEEEKSQKEQRELEEVLQKEKRALEEEELQKHQRVLDEPMVLKNIQEDKEKALLEEEGAIKEAALLEDQRALEEAAALEAARAAAEEVSAHLAAQAAEGGRRGAQLLALALQQLSQHPEAQARAAREAVEAKRLLDDGTSLLTASAFAAAAPYLDAVLAGRELTLQFAKLALVALLARLEFGGEDGGVARRATTKRAQRPPRFKPWRLQSEVAGGIRVPVRRRIFSTTSITDTGTSGD